jgi:radical SAM superfamily enzyme YgiQ (UPF0313 family)
VAALLPRAWELRLVDRAFEGIDDALWSWAELVMVSAMMAQREDALTLVDEARARGKQVVAGGPYPSLVPEDFVARGVHWVVRGEGEATVPLLLSAVGSGGGTGVIEEPAKPDLTRSPVPRFDLLKREAYVSMAVQTSRGCPFQCEFCDIGALYGPKHRTKENRQVLRELDTLSAMGWRSAVFVADDNFIGNRQRTASLLRELIPWMKARGNPFDFWTQASVNLGEDPELIDLMTEANFSHILLGIETPDESSLLRSRKAHNARLPLLQCVKQINANGLSVMGSFIVGFDGEAPGAGERVRAFADEAAIPLVLINALQALPHTPLWRRLSKEGRLREDRSGNLLTGDRMNFVPTRPEAEIRREIVEATLRLYDPREYLDRARRYYLRMRPTRRAMGMDPQPSARHVRDPQGDRSPRTARDGGYLLRLLWRHGALAPYRRLFWGHAAAVMRANPSRMVPFLRAVAMGEDVFRLRQLVRGRLGG